MSEYLDFAKATAQEAGEIMRKYFLGDTQTIIKADFSPVTIADSEINQMVIDMIAETYPTHSVLAEEQNSLKDSKYVWVCDPIDGTRYFAAGVPLGTFMLTLVVDGMPQVAVIYEPIAQKLYYAEKGKGAFLNNVPIKVSESKLSPEQYIDISDRLDHSVLDLRPASNILYAQGVKVSAIRCSGAAGAMVADGGIVAALTSTVHPHDIAAVKLIVEEAGGKVTDIFGNEQRYDQPTKGAIISNGIVHDELVKIISQTT